MELGCTRGREIDSQTMGMVAIHTDVSSTLENINIKQEPAFHTGSDSSKLSEHMKHVNDITNTYDVKSEVIDTDHYQHTDIHYDRDMCGNSNYTDSHMIHDAHVPPVKSEPDDEPLETHDQNEFIIEIDTCKDEHYETYPNNNDNVNLEEARVEEESGSDWVTKSRMHMEHSDTQHGQSVLHTSVDTTSRAAALSDTQYTDPDAVSQNSVQVHAREPTIRIHIQSTEYVNVVQHAKQNPHICSVCGVGFTLKGNMDKHMRTHTGEKPHKCTVCGAEFTHKHHLKRHTRTHTEEKPHKCSVCEVSFAQKGHLTRHMRIHTGEKSYKCTVCGVRFRRKCNLAIHMGIHTGHKPHKCYVCEHSFSDKPNLTKHMRTHTGERPHKCAVCGSEFAQKIQMKIHTRIHTGEKPHKCSVCDVGFAQKGNLASHMRTHTREKPYKCKICGVDFSQKSNLMSHRRIHTVEKPYK